jgi:hypothetical protein
VAPPSARATWAAWALTAVGGLSLLAAVLLLVRSDLGSACVRGAGCVDGLPPLVRVLAFGGTGLAILGGALATLVAVRRLARGRRSPG